MVMSPALAKAEESTIRLHTDQVSFLAQPTSRTAQTAFHRDCLAPALEALVEVVQTLIHCWLETPATEETEDTLVEVEVEVVLESPMSEESLAMVVTVEMVETDSSES